MKANTYLDKILVDKKTEVEKLISQTEQGLHKPLLELLNTPRSSSKTFSKGLKAEGLSVIAEIKRASPSKGKIGEIANPALLASKYSNGGAAAISVLTDFIHFGGSLEDLKQVKNALGHKNLPILRKDFLIHELQLCEAVLSGASAVLLIADVLGPNLKGMLEKATSLGLESLVEVHDEADLEIALDAKPQIIGVNNRDLKSFKIDLQTSVSLRKKIPDSIITISESGIHTAQHARLMKDAGYDAVLVGEALVKSPDPAQLISQFNHA